jgi:hypothetical protein
MRPGLTGLAGLAGLAHRGGRSMQRLVRATIGRLTQAAVRRRSARPIPLHAEVLAYLHITATLVVGGALRPPRSRAGGADGG